MSDEEEYDFEYSDEEEEEQNVDIENQYYNAKGEAAFFSASSALKLTFLSFHLQ